MSPHVSPQAQPSTITSNTSASTAAENLQNLSAHSEYLFRNSPYTKTFVDQVTREDISSQ